MKEADCSCLTQAPSKVTKHTNHHLIPKSIFWSKPPPNQFHPGLLSKLSFWAVAQSLFTHVTYSNKLRLSTVICQHHLAYAMAFGGWSDGLADVARAMAMLELVCAMEQGLPRNRAIGAGIRQSSRTVRAPPRGWRWIKGQNRRLPLCF